MANETVAEHFSAHGCYKDMGGCYYHDHVHVQFEPEGYANPLCNGGTGPPAKGGWPAPGSPNQQAFIAEFDRQVAAGAFPGTKHGSGFNCRAIQGSSSWSQHAYRNAVDIQAVDYAERYKVLDPVWSWLQSPWTDTDGGGTEGGGDEPPAEEGFLMSLSDAQQDFVYNMLNADQCERAGYLAGTGINANPTVTVKGKSVKVSRGATVEEFGGSWVLFNAWRAGLTKGDAISGITE